MTIEQLPGEIVVPTRDTLIEQWKRSHRLRVPDADTGPGTQPDVDARVAADALMPVYAAAKMAGRNAVLEEARGAALEQWGEREGVGGRRDAVGASGYVTIAASTGGTTIVEGDELVDENTNLTFMAAETRLYLNGDAAPILGKDTGPATNLDAGTPLKWVSPRPGCGSVATVTAQSDGSGLTGGRERESDDEYLARIQNEKRTRAASGNDAEYQLAAEATPQVAVQKAFTYPAIFGPGTTSVVFTMRPLRPGGSRVPTALQVSLVEAHVTSQMPADDGALFGLVAEEDVDVVYRIRWAEFAQGWEDLVQWPPYYEPTPDSGPAAIVVSSVLSSTAFVLKPANDDYTDAPAPQAGQTIGFYDNAKAALRRKRIGSVLDIGGGGFGPWFITCDTSNNASDASYTPEIGQRAMPWSEGLADLLPGLLSYFDSLGPGEQVSSFHDEGRRQRRVPRPPREWPHTLTDRALTNAIALDELEEIEVLEGAGVTPSVGTPGVVSNILKLRHVAFFPG